MASGSSSVPLPVPSLPPLHTLSTAFGGVLVPCIFLRHGGMGSAVVVASVAVAVAYTRRHNPSASTDIAGCVHTDSLVNGLCQNGSPYWLQYALLHGLIAAALASGVNVSFLIHAPDARGGVVGNLVPLPPLPVHIGVCGEGAAVGLIRSE